MVEHKNILKQYIHFISFFVLIFIGCESKFTESSPDNVDLKGLSLQERLEQKEKVDSRIDSIQKSAEKVEKIIELFKKVQDPSNKQDIYTPLDFLIDINSELKSSIPENKDGKLMRFAKHNLPMESLKVECRVVETMLDYSVIFDDQSNIIGDRLTYSLKTCQSEDKFQETIVAEWIGPSLEFKLINKNIESIFANLIQEEAEKNSTCKIKQGEKNIIDAIFCENFNIKLSTSEIANVTSMSYSNSDDIRFESIAKIYENSKIKALSKIKIFSNGDVKYDLNKTLIVNQ